MRNLLVFLVMATFSLSEVALAASPFAHTQTSAQEKAANLRAQLAEVETKQAELQTRRQQLDESMKPENIEQNLAGVGSTKPEDLREQRRKQLEIERNGVQKQIDLLATSHARLQTAIAQADAEAYRQSAAPATATVSNGPSINAPATTTGTMNDATVPARPRRSRRKRTRRTKRSHHARAFFTGNHGPESLRQQVLHLPLHQIKPIARS
jgi:prefoldin subunit 5